MKILFVDVETSPNVVYTFDLFNAFIAQEKIIEPSRMICWSASWLGNDEIMFGSEFHSNREDMVKGIYNLLCEADGVVWYNGDKFDKKVLNSEFIKLGLNPPTPNKSIDLYKVVKKHFRFPSNKLAYVVKALGIGEKGVTNHDLWVQCLAGDEQAWSLMKLYNVNDTGLLKGLYERVKGWIPNHPNWGLHVEFEHVVCPTCGSNDLESRGYRRTKSRIYKRYQCKHCGGWSSSNLCEKGERNSVLSAN
jgi:hypothetical protein